MQRKLSDREKELRSLTKKAIRAIYFYIIERSFWCLISSIAKIWPNGIYFYKNIHILLHKIFPHKFTSSDPLRVYWVPPEQLKYVSNVRFKKPSGMIERVRPKEPISNKDIYKDIENLIETGNPNYFKQTFREMTEDGDRWNLNQEEAEKRVAEIEKLLKDIKKFGYKRQTDLLDEEPEQTTEKNNDALHPVLNEIKADVGPNGGLYWRIRGQHRLIISQIIGIEEIPIIIGSRDPEWEKKNTALESTYRNERL